MAVSLFLFYKSKIEEEEFRDLKDRLMEQETLVEQLQQEMGDLRKIAQSHKEQEIQVSHTFVRGGIMHLLDAWY